jgi:hypothetical protein
MNPGKILLAALSASLLSACATGGASLSAAPPRDHDQMYYFRGLAFVDRQYIDRYACTDHRVTPICRCTSRLARVCDCRC